MFRELTSPSSNSIMAALPAIAVGEVHDARGPVDARVRVRSLNPQRNTFWLRQVLIDSPGGFVDLDSIRGAQPFLQDLLETQLPFMVKVVMRCQLSEEIVDAAGEVQVVYSERRTATVPSLVRPLANPDERLRRYVVSVAQRTIEDRLEHARFHNSLQKFEGFLDIQIFTTPSRELAQLPAAPGGNFQGGCWKELPLLLQRGNKGFWSPKNHDAMCFRYCVMGHILGCADWTVDYRKNAANRLGSPFYDHPRGRPGKTRRDLAPVDVYVDGALVDFGTLPEDAPVMFDDIDKFEAANAGLVEVFVYQWSTIPWLNDDFQYLSPVRSPCVDGKAKQTVLLLLHQGHYVLIYDLNKISSSRSPFLPDSQMADAHNSWNRCHRCLANFRRPETLRKHLVERACSQEPGKRLVSPMQMPKADKARLNYEAKPSAAMHPCVVYADFEVFSQRAPEELKDQRVLAKQQRVASFAYMAVGRSGFEVPPYHRMRLQRATHDSGEFGVVEFFLRSLLALAKEYRLWRRWTNIPCQMTAEEQRRFDQAEVCEICGGDFGGKRGCKVAHHEHGTGKFSSRGLLPLQPGGEDAYPPSGVLPQWLLLRLPLHPPLLGL